MDGQCRRRSDDTQYDELDMVPEAGRNNALCQDGPRTLEVEDDSIEGGCADSLLLCMDLTHSLVTYIRQQWTAPQRQGCRPWLMDKAGAASTDAI